MEEPRTKAGLPFAAESGAEAIAIGTTVLVLLVLAGARTTNEKGSGHYDSRVL